MYLASRDPSGLSSFVQAVSDPHSSQYGKYLSPAQVASRFGPSAAEASAVSSYLSSNGLKVTGSKSGIGGYVTATGSVADAGKAFGVSFGQYKDPTGQTVRAPNSEASVPDSVGSDVASVSGLDTATHFVTHNDTLPPPASNYWIAGPSSLFWGEKLAATEPPVNGGQSAPWVIGGYTAKQYRGAYGVTASGETGKGSTVAIIDAYASPTMQKDANQFAKYEGDQPFAKGQYHQYLAGNWDYTGPAPSGCGASGWYGEESLDVESVHGTAPDADVNYVGAQDCTDNGLLAANSEVVQKHLGDIVSESWGEVSDGSTAQNEYDQIFMEGAAEGIGFNFSTGDKGYEDPVAEDKGGSDQIQADYPDSSPYVTAVGGTSLAVGQNDNYEWELPWGTINDPLSADGKSWTFQPPANQADYAAHYDGSGGGGVSTMYAQPSYQQGVVPNKLATAVPEGSTKSPMRVVPDVSADADPGTGTLIGQTTLNPDGKTYSFNLSREGGTSLATPLFAGIEADAEQAAGHPLGFANPAIYQRAGTDAFNDVTEQTPDGPATKTFEARNDYTDTDTGTGPLITNLRLMGVNGLGASALRGTPGYDDATGVGSPAQGFIKSFSGGSGS
ncbi:MAG: S8/S53 family peptidase [Solirubrobacterales bacterium]|nr:S8/S53 family peptidase [Solirubrobacterales bacterium]